METTRKQGRHRSTAVKLFATALAAWLAHSVVVAQEPAGISSRPAPQQINVTTLAHPETPVRWGRAVGVVDAPLERVLSVLHDYGNYGEFMPNFRNSRVLSRRGTSALVYMQARLAKGTLNVWANLKLQSRQRADGTHVIEGRMTKGNMERMDARWEATALPDGRTLVAFQLIMDPDVPLMPAAFINAQTEKATRKTLKALRRRVAG